MRMPARDFRHFVVVGLGIDGEVAGWPKDKVNQF